MVRMQPLFELTRRYVEDFEYEDRYMATNTSGKICQPTSKAIKTISLRGAINRAAPTTKLAWAMFDWLRAHQLITLAEPKTREQALAVLDEAIHICAQEVEAA